MRRWLEDALETLSLLGGMLRIIHPEQYTAGIKAFHILAESPQLVKEGEAVLEILRLWSSPYSTYSIVSNRKSVMHRDTSSRPETFDMLLTLGDYHDGRLVFPNLGVELSYNPGAVVALSGKLIQHGVEEVEGDRVCLAFYTKDNVHERLKVPPPGWITLQTHSF